MIVYHRTNDVAAKAILREGFRDRRGKYMMEIEVEGVFVSNIPLDANEGAKGRALLRITLPLTESDLEYYELVEDGKPYREWVVPAALLDQGRIELWDDTDEPLDARFQS